jgi:hypothetical protein
MPVTTLAIAISTAAFGQRMIALIVRGSIAMGSIAPTIERCGTCTEVFTVSIPTLGMTTARRTTTVAGE